MYEKSLANLDKALDYEINTSIKMNGLVKKTKVLFSPNIYKRTSKVNKNTEIVIPTIIAFCKKNDIQVENHL
jgi:hypothetical protein